MKIKPYLSSYIKDLSSNSSGFAFIAIIMIIIVIFSVTLVSGAEKFKLSPTEPEEEESTDTSPTTTPGPETNPWSINYTITNCANGIATGSITATGASNGYVTLEIQESPGNFTITSSDAFNPPNDTLELILRATDGYDNTPWRLRLFQGGTGTKDNFSGGTERETTPIANGTNCS